jgi:hypothetical protein
MSDKHDLMDSIGDTVWQAQAEAVINERLEARPMPDKPKRVRRPKVRTEAPMVPAQSTVSDTWTEVSLGGMMAPAYRYDGHLSIDQVCESLGITIEGASGMCIAHCRHKVPKQADNKAA